MEANKYQDLVAILENNIIKGHSYDDVVMYRGINPDEKIIRVNAGGDWYTDVLFTINAEDSRPAWDVITKAWDQWFDDDIAADQCYGDWLEQALQKAGIWYQAEYPEYDAWEENDDAAGREEYDKVNGQVENVVRGWFGLPEQE